MPKHLHMSLLHSLDISWYISGYPRSFKVLLAEFVARKCSRPHDKPMEVIKEEIGSVKDDAVARAEKTVNATP